MKNTCFKFGNTYCEKLWKQYIYPVETGVNTTFSALYTVSLDAR